MVGTPVVAGAGFIALLLTVFAYAWTDLILSVVHEGGHMVMAVLTFRGFRSWSILGTGSAVTRVNDGSWGVGDILGTLAGYLAPPLVGLGGAAVLARGNAWGVLVIAAMLMFGGVPVRHRRAGERRHPRLLRRHPRPALARIGVPAAHGRAS